MTATVASSVIDAALASPVRPPRRVRPPRVPVSGERPRGLSWAAWRARRASMRRACAEFARDFPGAAAFTSGVELVDGFAGSAPDTAFMCAQTVCGARPLSARVLVLRSALADPWLDAELAADASLGLHLSASVEDALWHEFGHVLCDSIILRALPRLGGASFDEVARLLFAEMRTAAQSAHVEVHFRSKAAREDPVECLAESVLAARTIGDGPSNALYAALRQVYGRR